MLVSKHLTDKRTEELNKKRQEIENLLKKTIEKGKR